MHGSKLTATQWPARRDFGQRVAALRLRQGCVEAGGGEQNGSTPCSSGQHRPPQSRPGLSRSRQRRNAGFTLVEILVVVAIIGILAAIIIPAFSHAREVGRRAVCLNNLNQLGLAFHQYVLDNGGHLPGPANYQNWGDGGHWVAGKNDASCAGTGCLALVTPPYTSTGAKARPDLGAIYEYAKNPNLYFCPSNASGSDKGLSYSMNCALAGLRNNLIAHPQDIILLVDEDIANDGYFYATDNTKSGAAGNSTDALTQVHNGGGNLLFVDGHVKYYNPVSFPLDVTPQGQQNKYWYPGNISYPTVTHPPGWPRFHDQAFGKKGSALGFGNGASSTNDACNAPIP